MQFIVRTGELVNYIETLKNSFLVYYPIKANSNPKLVNLLEKYVDGFEVDSLYHLSNLIRTHKVEPTRILYSYPLKGLTEIKRALSLGTINFVVDNLNECYQLIKAAPQKVNIIIRVDVLEYVDCSNIDSTKWGASIQEVFEMIKLIQHSCNSIIGFSFYLPQEINNFKNLYTLIQGMYSELKFCDYEILDIGGGIENDSLSKLTVLFNEHICNTKTKVIIEQGRCLLNQFIDLQVNVISVRWKNDKKLVFIDTGIYHGLLDFIIKKRHYSICFSDYPQNCELEKCLICGDSSDISDILGVYNLPKTIKVGDKLIIHECGAYCEEFIAPFCRRKKPTILFD